MNEKIQRGDRLRLMVTCTADKVDTTSQGRWLYVRVGTLQLGPIPLDVKAVSVDALAPAEWPPRSGDLWQDAEGLLWFCITSARMINQAGNYQSDEVDDLLRLRGPFRLVHRDPNARTPWDDEPPF